MTKIYVQDPIDCVTAHEVGDRNSYGKCTITSMAMLLVQICFVSLHCVKLASHGYLVIIKPIDNYDLSRIHNRNNRCSLR